MKKFLSVLSINIVLLFFCFIFLNFFIEQSFNNNEKYSSFIEKCQLKMEFKTKEKNFFIDNKEFYDSQKFFTEPYSVKKIPFNKEIYDAICGEERRFFNIDNYNKNPIILMGCSYSYGQGLKKEETFPFILSKISKRPVVNFAECGGEIIQSYKAFLTYYNELQDKSYIEKTEYVLYVYMWDHINRYLSVRDFYNLYEKLFEVSKVEKVLIKMPFLKYLFASYKHQKVFVNFPNSDNASRILKKIVIIHMDEIRKYLPN